ncbi:MAG TPA: hypothetical protein ENF22_07660 [Chloroflexi bacterium]|nr:hypothetical protein [Chloroflexota bacterium]
MKKQSKLILFIILIAGITLFTAGCGNKLDEGDILTAVDTAVAETDTAKAAILQQTVDAEAAFTPTYTPAPTSTNTPIPEPTSTSTTEPGDFEPPLVQVSLDTNCRSGPGKVYPYLGGLFVGEESTVHGIDPSGAWYYIANPDIEDEYCWIWGYYAETTGDTEPLPIYTPGPTPDTAPSFTAEFRELETCNGAWRVEFTIDNTGPVTLESISVHVLDTVTDEQTGLSQMNSFMAAGGCDLAADEDLLFPGESGFTISFDLSEDPSDHYSFATITACTQENMAGNCFVSEFAFTP